jgi:predicted nucleotidyltransferase
MDRELAIARLREHFDAHPEGVVCAWLFGSTARGETHAGSDVDVAVLLAQDPPSTLAGSGVALADTLEGALGAPVDVVLLNRAPVDLTHRVLRDGVLVFDADPARRIAFEVRARSLYFDLKPILDQYRRKAGARRG